MKTIIPLTLLGLCSGAAIAANQSNDVYASIGAGMHQVESDDFDDKAPSMKILGGYNFNQYFALEAGYTKFFETSDTIEGTRVRIDGDNWELGTKLSYPISQRFSGHGRLGWSFYDMKAKVSDPDFGFTADENGDAFTWALGGGVKLKEHMALNAEYARILLRDADIDSVSLELAFRFRN